MNYFLLVSYQRAFLFCARLKPKKKDIKTKTFVEFNNHSPWSCYRIRLIHSFAGAVDYLSIFQVQLCYLLGDMRQGQWEEKYFKQRELQWNLETAVSESFPEIDNFYRKKALLGGTEFTMQ